jgi:hypothetical protein
VFPNAIAGQGIGEIGSKALAGSLAPQQDADGRWVFNGAMERLNLSGVVLLFLSIRQGILAELCFAKK